MAEIRNELGGPVTGPVVQAGQIGHVSFAPSAPTALAGLPPVDAEFTGRLDELDMLARALRPGADGAPVVVSALAGQAGVGKTALAVRAAHDAVAAGWFPGGVLFMNLQGYDGARFVKPEVALTTFLRALGVSDEHIPPDRHGQVVLYRSKLAELASRGKALLVVLDNASTTEQVAPLLPGSGVHRVIVTSRHFLGDLAGSRIVDLRMLGADEAVALIATILRTRREDDPRIDAEPEAAAELAGLCGRLPLALRIAAAILADDPGQPISELVGALRDTSTRLEELSYGSKRSVTAAFELSYSRLTPEEARLFRLLSLNPGQQISVDAAASLADLSTKQTKKLLGSLRRAHMIETGEPYGWFRFHDLLRLFAKKLADRDGTSEAALDRLVTHYHRAAMATRAKIQAGVGPDREAALAWLATEQTNLAGAVLIAHDLGRNSEAAYLTLELGGPFQQQRRDDALEIFRRTLESAKRSHNRDDEARALIGLGRLTRDTHDYVTARHHFENALAIYRELGDRENEAMALHSAGTAARRGGQYSIARDRYLAALALYQQLGNRRGAGSSLHNLGHVDREQRDYQTARSHYDAALTIFRGLGERVGQARLLYDLGQLAIAENAPRKARVYWEQALAAYEELGLDESADEVRASLAELI